MRPVPSLGETKTETEPKYVDLNQTELNLIQTKLLWFDSVGCPIFIVFCKPEPTNNKALRNLDFRNYKVSFSYLEIPNIFEKLHDTMKDDIDQDQI